MEGLFIAKILEDLAGKLPARNLGWVFPDETTAALLLEPHGGGRPFNLVFAYRPPAPALYLNESRLEGSARSPFQRSLEGRVKGGLEAVSQLKLDRVVLLRFAPAPGFIELPAVRLLFELTGRNANLLLLEDGEGFEGRILVAAREIASSRNRFRQVRSGGLYTPPPPYEKLDPRVAPDLESALAGQPLSQWHKRVDGLGPSLTAEVAFRASVGTGALDGERLHRAVAALRDVARDPNLSSETERSLSDQARVRARDDKLDAWRKDLRETLGKRLRLLSRQLEDVDRARDDAIAALESREWADTLLAFARDVPAGASSVTLPNLYGDGEVRVPLDPTLDAAANANRLYARAKRREEVLAALEAREPELRGAHDDLARVLASLETMTEPELERLVLANAPQDAGRAALGLRYRTRGGFEVLVGRNAKENAFLTHKFARSHDLWFHVQGYPGSHTILRSEGREVPFSDVLEAASVAAHHSKARGSVNVAVDYLPAKNVWRPKGAKPGQVYFTGQKTVFVDAGLPGDAK